MKTLLAVSLFLTGCAIIHYMTPHPITLYSLDGEVWKGEYVFTGSMKGTAKVTKSTGGEMLTGQFTSVDNTTYSHGFSRVFSTAQASAYGAGGLITGSGTSSDFGHSLTRTTAGQYQGIGVLTGENIVIECFYIGSMRTGNGFGRCKSNQGKEYSLQF
jgi:hypothetical protein